MMQAFATRATTWSGITLNWPVDGGGTLPVELSGLPIFDARGISSAIAASASAAISTPSRGSPRCAWRNCPVRSTPQQRRRAIAEPARRPIAFIRRIA